MRKVEGEGRAGPVAGLMQSGIHPRKRLGQNFLVNREVVARIIDAAHLSPDDVVIEVGAGQGVLTVELARKARAVIAVEIDSRLCGLLAKETAAFPNVTVVNKDILGTTIPELLAPAALPVGRLPEYKVIANIPYYITSPIITHFLSGAPRPGLLVLMVQKEVGEAVAIGRGKRGLMGAIVEFYGHAELAGKVPREDFRPVPKVDSVILRIEVEPKPRVEVDDEAAFLNFVAAGFTAPRKQLHNSLARGLGLEPARVREALEESSISPTRRAETLSIEEWGELYRLFRSPGRIAALASACS